jgi:hypothetical protein
MAILLSRCGVDRDDLSLEMPRGKTFRVTPGERPPHPWLLSIRTCLACQRGLRRRWVCQRRGVSLHKNKRRAGLGSCLNGANSTRQAPPYGKRRGTATRCRLQFGSCWGVWTGLSTGRSLRQVLRLAHVPPTHSPPAFYSGRQTGTSILEMGNSGKVDCGAGRCLCGRWSMCRVSGMVGVSAWGANMRSGFTGEEPVSHVRTKVNGQARGLPVSVRDSTVR